MSHEQITHAEGASGEQSKAGEPAAKAAEQAFENLTRGPGWAYLLMTVSLITAVFPLHLPLRNHINLHNALVVFAITLGLYWFGDLVDKLTFKKKTASGRVERYRPRHFRAARAHARKRLGIYEGSYKTAMAIIKVSEQGYFAVYALNELAKTLRSLLLPGWFICSFYAWKKLPLHHEWAITFISLSAAAFLFTGYYLYPHFKLLHISLLYRRVVGLLTRHPEIRIEQSYGQHAEISYFWEGIAVITARQMTVEQALQLKQDFRDLRRPARKDTAAGA